MTSPASRQTLAENGSRTDDDTQTTAAFATDEREAHSTMIINRRSPLLAATPPVVTRALVHSYGPALAINRMLGLLTWTGDDIAENVLVLVVFWLSVLYGDAVVRYGAILVIASLGLVMLGRSKKADGKSLDEIVDNLNLLTLRFNIVADPIIGQCKPRLVFRACLLLPVWWILTFFGILTTRRTVLLVGTAILTWHSKSARVTRTLFWRSRTIRRLSGWLLGCHSSVMAATTDETVMKTPAVPGVRFTFVAYENQRRWIGLGWTHSLLAYERDAWTDERLQSCGSKEEFSLPAVQHGDAVWRWIDGSQWSLDGDDEGWIYYDNKWNDGRRQDSYSRWTRRRRWTRDAELVDVSTPFLPPNDRLCTSKSDDQSVMRRRISMRRGSDAPSASGTSDVSGTTTLRNEDDEVPVIPPHHEHDGSWGVGDDLKMGLG